MATFGGWAIVIGSAAALGVAVFRLRRKRSEIALTTVAAAAGAGVGVGGLLVLDGVGVASWIVAPIVLAVTTPLQVRALLIPERIVPNIPLRVFASTSGYPYNLSRRSLTMAQTADDPVAQGDPPPAPTTFVSSSAAPDAEERAQPVDVGRVRRARRPLSDLPPGPRRTRVEIRRIGIWSVFKFSLLFSFCGMLIVFLALLIIYLVLQAAGALDSLERLLGYFVDTGTISNRGPEPVHIDGAVVFTYIFLGGCLTAVAWSAVSTVVALIYNLISDILGGIEVTLSERPNRFTR